jgi:hypothetical protein
MMFSELNGNTTTMTMKVTPQASDDRNEIWSGVSATKVLERYKQIRRSHKDQPELLNQ